MGSLRRTPLVIALGLALCSSCAPEAKVFEEGEGGAALVALPSCLRELFATCESDGKCRSAGSDVYCYASGARAEYTVPSESCSDAGRSEVKVTKPDGSLCFTFEVLSVASQTACEQGDYFWRNPAGELIAIGNFSSGSGRRVSITCTANGDSMSCEPGTCPTELSLFGNSECTPGDCP